MFQKIASLLFIVSSLSLGAQSFDTTALNTWSARHNSWETWDQGAFDEYRDTSDATDFGWGYYNMSTHLISGDSIYILKTIQGNFKAISINSISSGVYDIIYSDLDGSNRVNKFLDRANYNDRNFFYYELDADTVKDLEPASADWDILFTKYPIFYPGFGAYPVAGVLHNRGVLAAQVEVDSAHVTTINDTLSFPFSSNISTIGYDWKDAFAGVVHDTLTYFVKDQSGAVNELKFTEYGGSATGLMKFTVNGAVDSVVLNTGNEDQVYYSLGNANEVARNTDQDWDIAFFAQSSFSAIPIRINSVHGAELYVYPHKDINHWNSVGIAENPLTLVSAFPNPTKGNLTIVLNLNQAESLELSLVNTSGQVVLSEPIEAEKSLKEYRLNLSAVPAGVYQLSISGSGFGASTQLLVNP